MNAFVNISGVDGCQAVLTLDLKRPNIILLTGKALGISALHLWQKNLVPGLGITSPISASAISNPVCMLDCAANLTVSY